MADTIQVVNYYSIVVPNKAGVAAKVLGLLKDAGVDLAGFWGYPIKGGKAQLDIAGGDQPLPLALLKKSGYDPGKKKTAFLLQGENRVGALCEAMAKLGAAGISAHAAQAVNSGGGCFGALIQVAPEDVRKARKALGV